MDLASEPTVYAAGPPRLVADSTIPTEGYKINIDASDGVTIAASGQSGFFYGRATLGQLGLLFGGGTSGAVGGGTSGAVGGGTSGAVGGGGAVEKSQSTRLLPLGTVEDWPDLSVRGVMLDVSRCKVPTMETLFALVDRLASWKINHLELYMEHTYAYQDHREVWAEADPYDAHDMEVLSKFCAQRHVELVANQNTLGHMERWLMHDRYAPLGIERGVVMSPFGLPMPASTLDPANPGSLVLVRELLGELGQVVESSRFHVGLDEPWQLPAERRAEWSSWVSSLRAGKELDGRQMLVWGDFLAAHPDLLDGLADGVSVCEWGYEANHPFEERGAKLSQAGLDHWMCPGTSSWMSIVGRVTNAIDNCRSAALSALDTGASGLMVTDWGDFGHHQYLPIAEPGLAAAAAFSWCAQSNEDLDARSFCELLSVHSFGDPSLLTGLALAALGELYSIPPLEMPNMSSLVAHVYLPQLPVGVGLTSGLTTSHLEAVDERIDDAERALDGARPHDPNGVVALSELANAIRLVRLASADARARLSGGHGGFLEDVPAADRSRLADELGDITSEHRSLWLQRNRPGGLDESCAWLDHLRGCYLEGEAASNWAGPLVELIRARRVR